LIPEECAPLGRIRTGFFAKFFAGFPKDVAMVDQRMVWTAVWASARSACIRRSTKAASLPPERIEPCVRGIAFAFAMMNSVEMGRLLENSAIPYSDKIRAAFQNGLVYGLVFCDWFVPGFLGSLAAVGAAGGELTSLARK